MIQIEPSNTSMIAIPVSPKGQCPTPAHAAGPGSSMMDRISSWPTPSTTTKGPPLPWAWAMAAAPPRPLCPTDLLPRPKPLWPPLSPNWPLSTQLSMKLVRPMPSSQVADCTQKCNTCWYCLSVVPLPKPSVMPSMKTPRPSPLPTPLPLYWHLL